MSTSRKRHSKSRKGCTSCKSRHTKCDEMQPICSTCKRLDLQCVYPKEVISPRHNNQNPINYHSPPAGTGHGYSLVDLELLHHYTVCSCVKVKPGTDIHRSWTRDVPSTAFSHPYVLDQLLAVSALHVLVLDPSRTELKDYAVQHRARALENVQNSLRAIDNQQATPLFAFAILTSIHAFTELATSDQDPEACAITQSVLCFRLSRGVKTIINAHRNKIAESWAGCMLKLDTSKQFAELYGTGLGYKQTEIVSEAIRTRSGLTGEEIKDNTTAFEYCMQSIQLLSWRDSGDDLYHLIMAWPSDISEAFLNCLDRQEPASLVVLAHYAVLMNIRQQFWWFEGWPSALFERIELILDADWKKHLDWPRERLAARSWNANRRASW